MAGVVSYNFPVLLDPPGAVDVGNNSYRIGNGPIIVRSILTTVAHVGTYPDDSKYGPGTALYSDGTVRRPDLSIVEDIRRSGARVNLGVVDGRTITTNDTPRNADGTPFQWGRSAALAGAGIPTKVADAYQAAGVDILGTAIPIQSSTPIAYGPYRGLFPDSNGGTTLLDASGRVQVTGFDAGRYARAYATPFRDDNGNLVGAGSGNSYSDLQPSAASVSVEAAGSIVAEPDSLGSSPTFDSVPSTGGAPPITPSNPPSLSAVGAPVGSSSPTLPSAAASASSSSSSSALWILAAVVAVLVFSSKRG